MVPYFLLIALPVFVRTISKKYRFTSRGKLLFETSAGCIDVFMAMFLILLALRGTNCGSDTKQYLRLFNEYREQSIYQLMQGYDHELGYKVLNRIVGIVTDNYQIILIITSLMCVCPLWYFYKRESENNMLTIALFVSVAPFTMYFSGIRQAIAMSMGILAWYAVKDKKLWRFIAIVVIAIQFHFSAFMLFLLYPLRYAKITLKWLWVVVPCMIAVFIFRTPIFNFLLTFMHEEFGGAKATGATSILLLLVMFSLYSYLLPEENSLDTDVIAMRNMLLLSVVIQIFAMMHPLSMRMNYYFLIFVPVLIPKISNRSKKQFARIARISVIVMTVYFMYYFLSNVINDNDTLNIFPYIPFWEN